MNMQKQSPAPVPPRNILHNYNIQSKKLTLIQSTVCSDFTSYICPHPVCVCVCVVLGNITKCVYSNSSQPRYYQWRSRGEPEVPHLPSSHTDHPLTLVSMEAKREI